jgi:hypothetical protein
LGEALSSVPGISKRKKKRRKGRRKEGRGKRGKEREREEKEEGGRKNCFPKSFHILFIQSFPCYP